jgi:FAD-dependent urate hydroxylase
MPGPDVDVAVLGAGPYGLSVAAHLRGAGLEAAVFGEPMSFWTRNMPVGMFLRSSARASNISDPEGTHTLVRYEQALGAPVPKPVPLEEFVRYAEWFRSELVQNIDERGVVRLDRVEGGFRVLLADGDALSASRVVVAGGIAPFARRPAVFEGLPTSRVSHSVELRDPGAFRGKRIAVVGAGQSALESAALLHEAGADVELVARASRLVWIPARSETPAFVERQLRRLFYPPTEVGPRGLNWIAAAPDAFRRLPRGVQAGTDRACMAPMGAAWLRPRFGEFPVTLGRSVVEADADDGHVRMTLDDGDRREVDHVLLGTGFRVDVTRYGFLAPELLRQVRLDDGYPLLTTGLESSVPGLHFVGAPAARIFGPVVRFVIGTAYVAPALTRQVLGKVPPPIRFSF